MAKPLKVPSRLDVTNETLLEQWAREITTELNLLQSSVEALTGKPLIIDAQTMKSIRNSLMKTGQNPLNVDGLLGVLALPQVSGIVVTADITKLPAAQYKSGTLAVATGSPADTLYYNTLDGSGNHQWTALHAAGPTNMMTTDTAQNVTASKTWTAGQINSTSQFRSKAHNSGSQTINNNTLTALTFDTNDFDIGGVHSTTVNTSRFTVPAGGDGTWIIIGNCGWANHVDGHDREMRIRKNGATNLSNFTNGADADGNGSLTATAIDSGAVAGDYYEIMVFQLSTVNLGTIFGAGYTQGQAYKLS